ncbi:MAG: hypothetical protein IT542_02070 [Rubellimicrobium sp.]|nr:hypothetical protein [Rubellimicrobium sp.]
MQDGSSSDPLDPGLDVSQVMCLFCKQLGEFINRDAPDGGLSVPFFNQFIDAVATGTIGGFEKSPQGDLMEAIPSANAGFWTDVAHEDGGGAGTDSHDHDRGAVPVAGVNGLRCPRPSPRRGHRQGRQRRADGR